MERKMGDSLLRWLGLDRPPQHRVRHKVWKKQQADRTRQLLLGADRARQRTELQMLDGTDIVREVEAAGARHEATGAGPEAESGPAAEEEESEEKKQISTMGKGKKVSKKVVGSANGRAARGREVDGSAAEFAVAAAEPAPDESSWEVIYGSTAEGAARAMELSTALQAFASAVEVDGAMGLQLRSSIARKPQNITFRRFF
jgi:hypothetical protein